MPTLTRVCAFRRVLRSSSQLVSQLAEMEGVEQRVSLNTPTIELVLYAAKALSETPSLEELRAPPDGEDPVGRLYIELEHITQLTERALVAAVPNQPDGAQPAEDVLSAVIACGIQAAFAAIIGRAVQAREDLSNIPTLAAALENLSADPVIDAGRVPSGSRQTLAALPMMLEIIPKRDLVHESSSARDQAMFTLAQVTLSLAEQFSAESATIDAVVALLQLGFVSLLDLFSDALLELEPPTTISI